MLTRVSAIIFRQTLLKANIISQEAIMYRYIHLATRVKKTPRSNSLINLHRYYRITGIPLVRYASTNETSPQSNPHDVIPGASSNETSPQSNPYDVIPSASTNKILPQSNPYDEIPDPPAPLQEIVENIMKVHPNGEATFESLGLGGFNPVGLIQNCMEFVHIGYDIPWWTTIVIGTVCVRTILFPLVIMAQKNMIHFSNHMPVVQELQKKMTDARYSGDRLESARAATELMKYMKTNKISAMKNFIMPLVQAPIFISFFLALRGMANTPVESLKDGGFLWLQDLTAHDPYYIMPIVTSVTMYITIELGADGTNVKTMGMMRYVLRAVPFVILPFMIHFPGAILTYWASTNFVSLIQTGMLKIPYIRNALKMPTVIRHAPASSSSKKGFTAEVKESWTNMKISRQLAVRDQADAIQFNSAGKGPLVKTFKYDPTKQKQSTVLTKGR